MKFETWMWATSALDVYALKQKITKCNLKKVDKYNSWNFVTCNQDNTSVNELMYKLLVCEIWASLVV